jgi:hypothetical protein
MSRHKRTNFSGNSRGPVFLSNDNKVVGVVVWKRILFSNNVPTVIARNATHRAVKHIGAVPTLIVYHAVLRAV